MESATGPLKPLCNADATDLAIWLDLKLMLGRHEPMPASEVRRLKTALRRFLKLSGVE